MFWGLIMEPNKRYTQVVEKPFHISQAALDSTTGENLEPCQVMVVVDGKNFLVCTLQKNKCLQVPLDLYFKAGDSVSFLTNGKSNIHLTGYLDPEFEDEIEEEEEDDEEAPALVEPSKKRKLENAADQKSKKAKVDKKQAKAAKDDEEDSDDDEDDLEQMLANDDSDDDNDDSKVSDDSDEEEDGEEEEEEDDDEEEEQNGVADSDSDEAETTVDSAPDTSKDNLDLSKIDMSKLSKNQKKRLKKKLQQQQKTQLNGVDKPKDKKQDKIEKKGDKQIETPTTDKKEKKSLSGGVQIEDLKVGSGPVAKAGKVVQVYYEGRLKQNNKVFDQSKKGNGFKFRLGSKEVISGWDVGIAGMKVGGKRKILCPPAMAYGVKGSPPVIPPNSTLVFEVELRNVK